MRKYFCLCVLGACSLGLGACTALPRPLPPVMHATSSIQQPTPSPDSLDDGGGSPVGESWVTTVAGMGSSPNDMLGDTYYFSLTGDPATVAEDLKQEFEDQGYRIIDDSTDPASGGEVIDHQITGSFEDSDGASLANPPDGLSSVEADVYTSSDPAKEQVSLTLTAS